MNRLEHVVVEPGKDCLYLCGIEGCPRAHLGAGQNESCGLAKLGIDAPDEPLCATVANIDHWFDFGNGVEFRTCEYGGVS